MARMIPPVPHRGTNSEGEGEIFLSLRDDPVTRDWIVLHSLDIAHHMKQIAGEIDFVIIIPSKGVLCVEVKGCHSLRRLDGQWFYGPASHPDSRGPFKQASQAMHSLRKQLITRYPALSHILFWSAVIFPYIPFHEQSGEWHSWQVIDSNLLSTRSIGQVLERVLDEARGFVTRRPDTFWFHPQLAEPSLVQSLTIAQALRPNFEFFESPASRAHRQSEELKHYTVEQFTALDAMEANPRVLFQGPAGTGKTLLAIEAARRGYEAKHKVLLLCYNRLLGKWLEEQVRDLQGRVTCKTLHRYMLTISGLGAGERTRGFWQDELPLAAMDKLLAATGEGHLSDEIILDEAQDILRDAYLDVLDLSLRGGISSGRWRFFGDFEKQAIYNSAALSLESFQRAYAPGVPIYSLRVNCRNTPRIATLVHLLGGLHPGYAKILRPDNKVEPELKYYMNATQQQELLIDTLQRLYAEGFRGNDIVILSPRAVKASVAGAITSAPWGDRLSANSRKVIDNVV
jgi:hypothetical protein